MFKRDPNDALEKSIRRALSAYDEGDFNDALLRISQAIDILAKRRYGGGNKKRMISFLNAFEPVAMLFATNSLFVDCQFGDRGFGQIIYEDVRCALMHENQLSELIEFTDGSELMGGINTGSKNSANLYPKKLILGLIFSALICEQCECKFSSYTRKITFLDITLEVVDWRGSEKFVLAAMSAYFRMDSNFSFDR